MRALIVDDSKASRSILAKGLRELGFECAEAANGAEALELLAVGPLPDLVTVNRHMPVMDGVTLLSRLRSEAGLRKIKTLMVSTDGGKEGVETAVAAGADDFLAKPFTQEALARKLVTLGVCTEDAAGAAAKRPIRVLIVDDSATIRGILSSTLSADPDLQVAGTAVNGQAALTAIAAAPPDIVLLDVEMPVLDGIATLRAIRKTHPKLPVLMFSSLTDRGTKATLDALLAGANDYAAKPAGLEPAAVAARIREEVVAKIKALARRPKPTAGAVAPVLRPATPARREPLRGIVIAVSTGGPAALAEVLPAFASRAQVPIVIVQHMPAFFTPQLAERLSRSCGVSVREAEADQDILPGDVLLAPGGRHLSVVGTATAPRARLSDDPPENFCRPSADVLFRSAARVWTGGTLGIVLTGMGRDGLLGSRAIVEAGGEVIAQDEFTSVVWGMPGEVVRAGLADAVLPLEQIGADVGLRLERRSGGRN